MAAKLRISFDTCTSAHPSLTNINYYYILQKLISLFYFRYLDSIMLPNRDLTFIFLRKAGPYGTGEELHILVNTFFTEKMYPLNSLRCRQWNQEFRVMNCTTDAWKCHVIVRHFRIVQCEETLMEWKFPPNFLVGRACLLHQNGTLYAMDPFHYHGLTLVSTWMSSHMSYIMRDEITYPFRKFRGCTI